MCRTVETRRQSGHSGWSWCECQGCQWCDGCRMWVGADNIHVNVEGWKLCRFCLQREAWERVSGMWVPTGRRLTPLGRAGAWMGHARDLPELLDRRVTREGG
jgi:hypothetical protein